MKNKQRKKCSRCNRTKPLATYRTGTKANPETSSRCRKCREHGKFPLAKDPCLPRKDDLKSELRLDRELNEYLNIDEHNVE